MVTINKTDGTVLTTIADGAIDNSSTDITLVGRLYRNYGELINENFVGMLENFANTSSPSAPIVGQIWYDTTNKVLKVYRSTGFVSLGRTTTSSAEPGNATVGDQWYDTTDAQLKFYNGSSWVAIATGGFTSSQGKTGAFAETIIDVTTAPHIAVVIYQQGSVISIFSKDTAYTPQAAISGFTQVKKGLTLSSLSDFILNGTAANAQLLDSLDSLQFLRSDESDTTTGVLTIDNDGGLIIGDDQDFTLKQNGSVTEFVKNVSGQIQFKQAATIIGLWNIDEQFALRDGTAPLPSYTWINDYDTGMYHADVNTIGFSTNGVETATIDPDGLYVDGTITATSFVGTLTGDVIGNISGDIAGDVTGNLTGNVSSTSINNSGTIVTLHLGVTGNTTLGDAAGDNVIINCDEISVPNGVSFTNGQVSFFNGILVESIAPITPGNAINVTGNLDISGTLKVGTANAFSVAADGTVTMPQAGTIRAFNTAKYWCVYNATFAGLAIYDSHNVDTVTRVTTNNFTFGLAVPLGSSYQAIAGSHQMKLKQSAVPSPADTSILLQTTGTEETYTTMVIYGA